MRKTFQLEELDCAHCAARMEDAIRKIPGVEQVSVSFITQKLTLEAEEALFDDILKQAARTISKIEPDCRIAG